MTNTDTLLYYKQADYWNEALPIGNGRLGAMIRGRTDTERIDLNLDELWSGYPCECADISMKSAMEKARELSKNGKCAEATRTIFDAMGGRGVQGYMPFGYLTVEFGAGEITDYRRYLSLNDGTVISEYTKNGSRVKITSFASFPEKSIIWHFVSEKPESMKISLHSDLRNDITIEGDTIYLDGECPGESPKNVQDPSDFTQFYFDNPQKRGILYRGGVRIVTDGTKTAENGAFILENASEVTLFFTAESSFNGYNVQPFLNGKEYKKPVSFILDTVSVKNISDLLCEHTSDYSKYYCRTELCIGHEEYADKSTDDLLKNVASYDETGLVILLYNYAKYLMISASRPGSQAMNLQGIWNKDTSPAWNSNYTVNINTQMNYWPVFSFAIPEMALPMNEFILTRAEAGFHTAKVNYEAEGFVIHYNSDLWAKTFFGKGNPRYAFWPLGSGWLCRHLYEYYLYTNDREFLEKVCLPTMKEACRFYLFILVEDDNKNLVISPSASPENDFWDNGEKASVSYTTAMANSIVKDLFVNYVKGCDDIGIHDDYYDRVKSASDRIRPLRIGSDGAVMEWDKEETSTEAHHRHTSHLYGLYPGHEIQLYKTKSLCDAAKKTLELRGDAGTGWGMSWKACFKARLGQNNKCLDMLKMILNYTEPSIESVTGRGGMYPNMFDTHPPFQIDGNFGFAAAVNEAILQYDGEDLYLLPALPDKWKDGHITGTLIPGGGSISIFWKDGKLEKYDIKGTFKGRIYYDGKVI